MSDRTLRWGILGTASIATRRLIPALHASTRNEVVAIASRNLDAAQRAAFESKIERAHGSYDELLADDGVDAVYIPLPNHMHLEWSLRAIAAGKHVLCEKPVGLNAGEARALRDAARAHPELQVMEAFMYRCHPRWRRVHQLVSDGAIGDVGTIHTVFSYDNRNANDIRNQAAMGGGAWLDIGCYGVSVARLLFGREPVAVHGTMKLDPVFGTDRLTSAVLDFGSSTATVSCATQLEWHQSVSIHGTKGRIDVPIPFNPPGDQPTRIALHRHGAVEEIVVPACDQFLAEVDGFAASVFDGAPLPLSLDDSVGNMTVLDALNGGFR